MKQSERNGPRADSKEESNHPAGAARWPLCSEVNQRGRESRVCVERHSVPSLPWLLQGLCTETSTHQLKVTVLSSHTFAQGTDRWQGSVLRVPYG